MRSRCSRNHLRPNDRTTGSLPQQDGSGLPFAPLLFTATLPLLLLSGVLLPLTRAPGWLRALAAVNPLAYAVDAARSLFNNHLADASVVKGVLIMAVLAVLAVALAARSFGQAIA